MKVILYIGHHKVGSTALQAYLAQNWYRLAKAGILYPGVEGHGFANALQQTLKLPSDTKNQPVHIREPHSALAYRMMADVTDRKIPKQFSALPGTPQMIRALRKQTEALTPHTVLLCSEAFANFGMAAPELINTLCAIFPDAQFQVYCALRRPDDYLTSWHGQRLKVAELGKPLPDDGITQYRETIHFDYRLLVEPWIERVPNMQLTLRNYADVLATGGSAEDFVSQTGLTLPAGMTSPGRANASLPLAAFPIMEHAIRTLPPEQTNALSRYLLDHGRTLSPVNNSDIEVYGASQRAKLVKAFAPIDQYLSTLTGQSAFFPDLQEMAKTRSTPVQDAARQLLTVLLRGDGPAPALPADLATALQPLNASL